MTNQTNILRTSFVQVCSLLCIALALFLTGCAKKKVEEKVVTRGFMYMEYPKAIILQIDKEGVVTTGEWESTPGIPWSWWKDSGKNVGSELTAYPGNKFVLEGPAQVGDHFRYRLYYKEILLETGEMKKVLEKVTVESDKMADYQKQMAATESPKTQ